MDLLNTAEVKLSRGRGDAASARWSPRYLKPERPCGSERSWFGSPAGMPLWACGFRAMSISIPKRCRSGFRIDADHDSDAMPITNRDGHRNGDRHVVTVLLRSFKLKHAGQVVRQKAFTGSGGSSLPQERLSMRKFKEVLRLHSLGFTQRQIARSCSIAQSTVHEYLKAAAQAGVNWPLPEEWNEQQLEGALSKKPRPSAKTRQAAQRVATSSTPSPTSAPAAGCRRRCR